MSDTVPAPRRLLSRALPLLKASVSIGVIAWLAQRFDWHAVGAAALRLPWQFPVLAFLAGCAGVCLWPLRLQQLLGAQSVSFSYLKLLRITFVGLFFGNLLPSSMGGDAVKLGLLLREHPGRKGRITISVVADRLANVSATFLLLVVVSAVPGLLSPGLAPPADAVLALRAGLIAVPLVLALAIVWLRHRFRGGNPPHGGGGWRERLVHLAHGGLKVVMNWVSAPLAVASAVALSVASTLVFFGASRLLAAGVGIAVRPADWIFVQCLLSVIGILPISLNGLGVQEAGVYFLLGRIGVPAEPVLAYALLNRVLFISVSLPGAAGWLAGSGRGSVR